MNEPGMQYDGLATSCVYCVAGFPHEPNDKCPVEEELTVDQIKEIVLSDIPKPTEPRPVGRPQKDAGDMDDPLSSGRKRAAEAAPISVGMICEWAYLRQAGGGVVPIIGCPGNPATDRHHGPNKNTLDNRLGENLHRICKHCHNRYHGANDKFYPGIRPTDDTPWLPDGIMVPHDPDSKMSKREAMIEELKRMK